MRIVLIRFFSCWTAAQCTPAGTQVGTGIPSRALGFPTLEAFLATIPDTCSVQWRGGQLNIVGVASSATAAVAALISKQSNKKSGGGRRMGGGGGGRSYGGLGGGRTGTFRNRGGGNYGWGGDDFQDDFDPMGNFDIMGGGGAARSLPAVASPMPAVASPLPARPPPAPVAKPKVQQAAPAVPAARATVGGSRVFGPRVRELLANRPHGCFRKMVEKMYEKKWGEGLPGGWLEEMEGAGVRVERVTEANPVCTLVEGQEGGGWAVGTCCVARWAVDGVWYRARVDARQPDGTYAVTFLDYGNQDVVAEAAMVAHREQVPEAEVGMIDEFVLEAKEKDQVEVKKVLDKEERIEKQIEKVGKKTEKVENAVAKRVEKKEEKNLEKPAETQTSVSMSPWVEGEEVLARWEEDGVWYRAKVLGVTQDGVVRVVFTDYGNEDDVVELARSVELIPDTEELDEHVEKVVTPVRAPKKAVTSLTAGAACYVLYEQLWHPGIVHALLKDDLVTVKNLDTMSFIGVNKDCVVLQVEDIPEGGRLASSATKGKKVQWKVGERCVARWSEDGVWYRAEVVAAAASAFTVRFMDYGNEAEVAPADLVRCGREVPVGAEVDEHVEKVEAALKKEEPKEKVGTQRSSWVEGDEGVARWEEDGIWYRAKVLGVGMAGRVARVVFTDYGNEDDVFELARSVELLADSEVLDEHVKKSMAPVVVKEVMPKVATAEVPSVKPQPRRTLGRPRTAETALEVKEPMTKGPVAASPPPELACCVCHTVRKVSNDPFCPPG